MNSSHKNGLDPGETDTLLAQCRALLLRRRAERIRPLRDDKIITSWNGLMIAALARGGGLCAHPDYINQAASAAQFVLNRLKRSDGRLLRSFLNGPSETPAFLEDHAFLALGLLELYEATLDPDWLEQANLLAGEILRHFRDPASDHFRLTGQDAEQMPLNVSSDHDGVTPSALAVTARVLLRLSWIRDEPELLRHARAALDEILPDLRHSPLGHLGALQVVAELESEPVIATLSGPTGSPELKSLLSLLKQSPLRLAIRRGDPGGSPRVTLCANRTCYPDASTPDELKKLLQQIALMV